MNLCEGPIQMKQTIHQQCVCVFGGGGAPHQAKMLKLEPTRMEEDPITSCTILFLT